MVTKFQILPIDQKDYHFAKYYWDIEGNTPDQHPYVHSIIPKGISGLIFIYKGAFRVLETGQTFQKGDLIFGAQRSATGKFQLLEDTGLFGISFYPYVGSILLDTPGPSLINQVVDLSSDEFFLEIKNALLGSRNSNERVINSLSTLDQVSSVIRKNDVEFCRLIDSMSDSQPMDLKELVSRSKLSLRQFQRKFKNLTGYSPTEYLRIKRIQPILASTESSSLTRLALKYGYYDQSHFINDFKKMTDGIRPGQYFDESGRMQWIVMGEDVGAFSV